MATNPISTPLPADLPENWIAGQTVAPNGSDVGLAEQYGYNYQSQQINDAQTAINTISEAFENLYGNTDTVPVVNGGTGATTVAAALANLGAQPGFNFLVNPFFKYNGRNQTTYTATSTVIYTVDGWYLQSDNGVVSVSDLGVTVSISEPRAMGDEFAQKVRFSGLQNAIYTFSMAFSDGKVYSVSGNLKFDSEIYFSTPIEDNGRIDIRMTSAQLSKGFFIVRWLAPPYSPSSVTITAAKLELGSVSTLAADIAGAQNETLEQLRLDMYDLDPGRPAYVLTQNENLLGNWYFVGGGSQQGGGQFPINQLSQKIYNAVGITADQWYINNAGMSVTINSDGLLIKHDNTTNSEELHQKLPITILKSGQTYCFSALTKEAGIISVTFTYNGQEEFGIGSQITANGYIAAFRMTSGAFSAGHFSVRLITNIANASVTLIAAKLELGFRSTLAHLENGQWVLNDLPNFQQELAKCQRHQVLLGSLTGNTNICLVLSDSTTKAYGFLNTPVPLRINPTILQSSNLSLLSSTLQEIPVTKIQALVIGNSGLYFDVTASGLTANTVYWLRIKLGGIILDANL